MAKSRKAAELLDWYNAEKPSLEALARTSESILQNLIKKEKISIVSIASRVKSPDSLLGKQRRKRYKNPASEITDLVGLRVITYTEDDAGKVCEIVKNAFQIDAAQSIDKGQLLEVDQIGYRSFHFICSLGDKRVALPEFEAFKGRVFEVQIRTVLQHAWAEVEHDRNYKFSGVLPKPLARRLYLISGLLEMGDRELNQLSRDIDAYAKFVKERAKEGKLDDELNTTTLLALIPEMAKSLKKAEVHLRNKADNINLAVKECLSFGIKTTADFKALFTPKFIQACDEVGTYNTEIGFVRDAMMFSDMERYLKVAWNKHWSSTDPESVEVLTKNYPKKKVLSLLAAYGISVFEEETRLNYEHPEHQ